MSVKISGEKYAMMYGPTVGDKVRLADTSLVVEVEKDFTTYGDEIKFGGGKTIRDGMGQSVKTCSKDGDLDLVITNALIVDYKSRYRYQRRQNRRNRKSRKPGYYGRRNSGHDGWSFHRGTGRRRHDRNCRRN